jgi:RNA polymerase sigma-70 factor (sigma-E family)
MASAGWGVRELIDAHYDSLYRYAYRLSGSAADAEDLTQEAFVRTAPKIGRLRSDEVRPYLRTVAVNLWKNRIRRLAAEALVRRRLVEADDRETSVEDRDEMWAAISNLPSRQRACLVLRFYEDLSVRDTARLLGCSEGTVKSQTSKALEKLRKEWRS